MTPAPPSNTNPADRADHCSRIASVSLDPDPADWPDLARSRFALLDERAKNFRAQLKLPTDRPVILTGHQAQFWHPGILAKIFAGSSLTSRLHTAESHAALGLLIVDHDDNDPFTFHFPVLNTSAAKPTLRKHTFTPTITTQSLDDTPACRRPILTDLPTITLPPSQTFALPSVASGITHIFTALCSAASKSSNAAEQVAHALLDLIDQTFAAAPEQSNLHSKPILLLATGLSSTDLFRTLLQRMLDDPARCVSAYNAAAKAHPHAHMTPLALSDNPDQIELPLWKIPNAPKSSRIKATVAHVRAFLQTPSSSLSWSLAPRALFMTGLLRLAGADLFIHGVGGSLYDPITEIWFNTWLGADLAPTVTATATLTLDFSSLKLNLASLDTISRARSLAHHARHDPSLLSDPALAEQKSTLVKRISDLKRRKHRDPAAPAALKAAFRDLQTLLNTARTKHAAVLADLNTQADRAATDLAQSRIAADRTYCFALHNPAHITQLARDIDTAFSY